MAKSFIIAFSFLLGFSSSARAESLFITCSRETAEYSYEVHVYQTVAWQKIGPGDQRSEARIVAVRTDKNGEKSVRNYTGDMHRYPKHNRLWVGLYKRNTNYGQLDVGYSRRKISQATVTLYEGPNERKLAMECAFE